jgi:hypothetical protein
MKHSLQRLATAGVVTIALLLASSHPSSVASSSTLPSHLSQAQPSSSPPFGFTGRYLLTLSDADMVPSAYVDGQLGERQASVKDTLTILPLPLDLRNRSPQPMTVGRVNISNAVTAWPFSLAVAPNGRSAFVIETSEPAPANAKQFNELPVGRRLRSLDLTNPMQPQVVDAVELGNRPEAIDINPQGDLLLVTTSLEPGKQLHLVPVTGARLGQPQSFPVPAQGSSGAVTGVRWHPSGRFFAVALTNQNAIAFYQVNRTNDGRYQIQPWGNPVPVGRAPVGGYFTPDGQFFVTNSVHWGEDVDGFFVGAPPGSLTSIRFVAKGNNPQHQVVSTVQTGISPEGLAMSRDGRLIATPNMIRSYVPWDDARLTPYSSISLTTLDPTTGQLRAAGEYRLEGKVLPQGIVFDADGQNLAVTSAIDFDFTERRGGIHFFRVIQGDTPRLESTGFQASVVRGAHQLVLIP